MLNFWGVTLTWQCRETFAFPFWAIELANFWGELAVSFLGGYMGKDFFAFSFFPGGLFGCLQLH